MNYSKIYKDIITKARNENRRKGEKLYYESHHIIPECLFKHRSRKGIGGFVEGNPNDPDNIILLTAREHFICHVLLYKMYKKTAYEFKLGSALNFFFTKVIDANHLRFDNFQCNSKKYECYRKIGLDNISKARRGKMPVVDSKSRESMGSVDVTHPKVVSGEWVHHSKGRKLTEKEKMNRPSQKGANNTNYKLMDSDRKNRIFDVVGKSIIENHLQKKLFDANLKLEFNEFKKVSYRWVLNNFNSFEELLFEYNNRFNTQIQYNPYFRSLDVRKALSTRFNNIDYV